jgi:hypothetical protein
MDREIAPPIVGPPLQRDPAPGVDLGDLVGAAAERRRKRRLLEMVGIDRVLRQDRHQAEDERQLAVLGVGELEADLAFAGRRRVRDLDIVGAQIRQSVIAQELP